MMTKATLVLALLVSTASVATAQQQDPGWTYVRFYRVHLRNGNCVDGDLVKRTDREVILRLPSGEIAFRNDQIDRVEFVKMKSYNEPAILLSKKVAPKEAEAPATAKAASRPAEAANAAGLIDTVDPIPSDVSQETANAVDQAILVWKKASEGERQDLSETLIGMGASAAPYLEFLIEKRARTTPLEPVALALVKLSEDRFIDLGSKLMGSPAWQMRAAAMAGLAKATSDRRMPMLLDGMEDTDPTVWKIATDAVMKAATSDSDKRTLSEQIASRIRSAKNNLPLVLTLAKLGGRAAHDALWDLVNDTNETNRQIGLNGVAIMGDLDDGPKVQALLNDPSQTIKKAACLTVGKLKYAPAVPDLVNLLSDPNEGLQKNARYALLQITNQGGISDTNEAWKEWWDNFGIKDPRYK